jgi:hypothetical protein
MGLVSKSADGQEMNLQVIEERQALFWTEIILLAGKDLTLILKL